MKEVLYINAVFINYQYVLPQCVEVINIIERA